MKVTIEVKELDTGKPVKGLTVDDFEYKSHSLKLVDIRELKPGSYESVYEAKTNLDYHFNPYYLYYFNKVSRFIRGLYDQALNYSKK